MTFLITRRKLCLVFTAIGQDLEEEVTVNKKMLQNVIDGVSSLSQNLKFVVFPGGTRVRKNTLISTPHHKWKLS